MSHLGDGIIVLYVFAFKSTKLSLARQSKMYGIFCGSCLLGSEKMHVCMKSC